MHLQELRPGLHRWTARHPEWQDGAEPESPADWPPDVGCVAYEAEDALVLVDPLVPAGAEELETELDERVRAHGRPVAIVTTIGWHRRSRDELADRYRASTSRARANLPRGVVTIPIRGAGETMVWLPEHRALISGDRLLGDGAGGLRLCPESWLRYLRSGMTLARLRDALRPLLDLPVELVLVSHGDPVLENGRAALAEALLAET
jgi:glyoxylase-like metal-dependent hydrolase (beta-lactamase superfamily II)